MEKKEYEELLNLALSTGADFAELYYEESYNKTYNFCDSKLDGIKTNNKKGIGIRIIKGEEYFYTSLNDLDYNEIIEKIKELIKNISDKTTLTCKLSKLETKDHKIKISHNEFKSNRKKSILQNIDHIIRKKYREVTQVILKFVEEYKAFTIANSKGVFVKSNSMHTRYIVTVYTGKNKIKRSESFTYGEATGYEFLNNFDIEKVSLNTAKTAVEKLNSTDFRGGEYPIIISSGFGAVIFHEACGHGLEATSVAHQLSIFSNSIGKKVASEKVTLIDDGTLKNMWGSNIIDDEGNQTRKIVLIEKGILKNYLIDEFSSKKMKIKPNGCGRRQDYTYAPTSRMSNTYLAPGTDKIEDMFNSIKLGIYCEKLSGGTVNPATGDFNFAVDTAYLIENGKKTKLLNGVTLIGNGKEILNKVEMISDDLKIADGYCGSKSGMIHVTIGQPTIKISKILVGGKE